MKTSFWQKNLKVLIILLALALFFVAASSGMQGKDVVITTLRGLSVGAVTFLVASGFSLIFGLLDVLNLAQGALYMIGAYVGWTVFVRPDTLIDLITPLMLFLAGFALNDLWVYLVSKVKLKPKMAKIFAWILIVTALGMAAFIISRYPIAGWDLSDTTKGPIAYSQLADMGNRAPAIIATFEKISPVVALGGLLFSSSVLSFGIALLRRQENISLKLNWKKFVKFSIIFLLGMVIFAFNTPLTDLFYRMSSNLLFLIAIIVAILSGMGLGALMETTLIQPLYSRPIYQLMLTLGLGTIGIQIVRAIWGIVELKFPKPEIFIGDGEACPATSFADWVQFHCKTIFVMGGRVRVYDEIFIPIVGILVLVVVWIILKKTRIGMIIRAGVQDRQMVEALGINVRRVFTLVFAIGVGLAALGGVLAAPSSGLSTTMGEKVLLNALIALAIGGLTSYPGAALGALLVGLIQQFMTKYGQVGIPLPFTDNVFKPSPPLVSASTILLMVIVLLILPNGLLGKKE